MPKQNRLNRNRSGTLSLRNAIVLGIAMGIIMPALIIGPFVARQSYQAQYEVRVRGPLLQYAGMLEQTMSPLVWNVDAQSAQTFINSVMKNPDVISIVVEDASSGKFVRADRPGPADSELIKEVRVIKWNDVAIGRVTIQMSDKLVKAEFFRSMFKLIGALFFQLLISFFLLLMLFQRRIMLPVRQLQKDVDRLGEGNLEAGVHIARNDEMGDLALGVDDMRIKLDDLIKLQANHSATLEQHVTDRTLALHTANQELSNTLTSLRNAQMEIQRSERLAALGSLVAGVAHELNTPIGNSVTVASTLHDLSAEFQEKMANHLTRSMLANYVSDSVKASDILLRNLSSAADLIGSFKRVAVDRTSAQRRDFMLDVVIKETLLTLSTSFKSLMHEVQVEIPVEIKMDSYPGPLGQIITNLINNAILHGFGENFQGPAQIIISARLLPQNQDSSQIDHQVPVVELSISDNGVGISDENLGRIFDPFFTTKLGRGGSGLGLNIVYNLVTDVLGGSIRAESKPDAGARFIMTLPLSAPKGNESVHYQ
jgi:two-component system NtrC family sensor kinase